MFLFSFKKKKEKIEKERLRLYLKVRRQGRVGRIRLNYKFLIDFYKVEFICRLFTITRVERAKKKKKRDKERIFYWIAK